MNLKKEQENSVIQLRTIFTPLGAVGLRTFVCRKRPIESPLRGSLTLPETEEISVPCDQCDITVKLQLIPPKGHVVAPRMSIWGLEFPFGILPAIIQQLPFYQAILSQIYIDVIV